MEIDVRSMTEDEQKQMGKAFKNMPCFWCGASPRMHYRKVYVRGLVAMVPLCLECMQKVPEAKVKAAIEKEHDAIYQTRPVRGTSQRQ